jgi:DNA-binding MarR family transcriptional regulator
MDIPEQTVVRSIKRLYLLMNRHIEEILKQYGLARSQFQVLYFTNKVKSLTQKDLQTLMQIEPATLTVIVDGLAKKGLLERTENANDKRSKFLKLTSEGERLRKKIPSLHEIIENKMFAGITENKKKEGIKLMEQIIKNLER